MAEEFVPFPHFSTDAIHEGQEPEQWSSRALIPLISLSTTFKQEEPGKIKVVNVLEVTRFWTDAQVRFHVHWKFQSLVFNFYWLFIRIIVGPILWAVSFCLQEFEYSRGGNPTRNLTEKCIAKLENGKHCKWFQFFCIIKHRSIALAFTRRCT